MAKHYDIFISYRRRDAGDKAEHLKDLLESDYRNRISFDRENLTGKFNVQLIERIDMVKDFLLVIGKNSLCYDDHDRSDERVAFYRELTSLSQQEFARRIDELGPDADIDYVRIEIGRALRRHDLHIIPIVPERSFDFNFASLNLPSDIAGVKTYEAVFYSDSPDALFKDVVPKVYKHMLSKADFHINKNYLAAILLLLLIVGGFIGKMVYDGQQAESLANYKASIEDRHRAFRLNMVDGLTSGQMDAIDDILNKMTLVKKDTLWMSQFEFTKGQWYGVLGQEFDAASYDLPLTDVSFGEFYLNFLVILRDMTGIEFDLPYADEWQEAACGNQPYDYAGSADVESVAWYSGNSAGQVHTSNGQQGKDPNSLDLYDMCGNVRELCNTPLITDAGEVLYTACGGDFMSEASDVMVSSRTGVSADAKEATLGFRLVIRNL